MSFKISVPRTNYIQNKKVVDSPVQMTQAALQSQGRAIGYREAASTFGLQSSRPTGGPRSFGRGIVGAFRRVLYVILV